MKAEFASDREADLRSSKRKPTEPDVTRPGCVVFGSCNICLCYKLCGAVTVGIVAAVNGYTCNIVLCDHLEAPIAKAIKLSRTDGPSDRGPGGNREIQDTFPPILHRLLRGRIGVAMRRGEKMLNVKVFLRVGLKATTPFDLISFCFLSNKNRKILREQQGPHSLESIGN